MSYYRALMNQSVPLWLDKYPAALGFGLDKIKSTATRAIRVRRTWGLDPETNERDIGFTAAGLLDTTALWNHVTANGTLPTATGTVSVWYNQMTDGASQNFVQPTADLQPIIIDAGNTVTHYSGGRPAMNLFLAQGSNNNTGRFMALQSPASILKNKSYSRAYLNCSQRGRSGSSALADSWTRGRAYFNVRSAAGHRLYYGWNGNATHYMNEIAYSPDGTLRSYNSGATLQPYFEGYTSSSNFRLDLNTGLGRIRSKRRSDGAVGSLNWTDTSGIPTSFSNTDAASVYLNSQTGSQYQGTHTMFSAFVLYDTNTFDADEAAIEAMAYAML